MCIRDSLRPKREVRSWRPDLLLPIAMPKEIRSSFKLIQSIVYPKGSVKILVLRNENESEQKNMEGFLDNAIQKFKEIELPVSYTVIDNTDFNTSINVSMQSLNAAFFKPNIVFITVDPLGSMTTQYDQLMRDAKKNNFGGIIYIPFSTAGLAIEKSINLWITNVPADWKETFSVRNNDLSALISILICRNWKGSIHVHILNNDPNLVFTDDDIEDFRVMVRFPNDTTILVKQGDLLENIKKERNTDVNIINIEPGMMVGEMVRIVNESRISAVFCADSEYENVLV